MRLRGELCGAFLRGHVRTRTGADPDTWPVGHVLRAELLDESGEPIDDILVSVHATMPMPDVRLHLHGSPAVVACCRELLRTARFTEESEAVSTLWASTSLIEAEAHALLPQVLTLCGVEWLTRQPRLLSKALRSLAESQDAEAARRECEEIISRRKVFDWLSNPLRVALVGPPNAGKSTLANALADRPASIVSPAAGTTRDWIEIPGEAGGFPVLWLDTAGLGTPGGALETEAIRRTHGLLEAADAILLVLDAEPSAGESTREFLAEHRDLRPTCVALNKVDLADGDVSPPALLPDAWRASAVPVSAIQRVGLEALEARLLREAGQNAEELTAPAVFSARQVAALEEALGAGRKRFRQCVLDCLGAERTRQ
jgi:small GTP-binding protein